MLQFFKSRTYTFHPQIVIKTFEGNGKNLSIVIKTFERTGKSLPPSIISKEDERSMSQGRISEGDKPPVKQEKYFQKNLGRSYIFIYTTVRKRDDET